jgi:hypothetical protein
LHTVAAVVASAVRRLLKLLNERDLTITPTKISRAGCEAPALFIFGIPQADN